MTGVFGKAEPSLLSMLLFTILPVTSECWWFVSAYIFLMVLSPVINSWISKIGTKTEIFTLIAVWALWYSASAFNFRYSGIQRAVFFYLVGVFIKRHGIPFGKWTALSAFIMSWILFAALDFMSSRFAFTPGVKGIVARTFFSMAEISVCVPVAAIACFRFFMCLSIGNGRIINTVAASTFGIYLLHDSPFGRNIIWDKIFHALDVQYKSVYFPLLAFCTCLAVFVACSAADLIRKRLFENKILSLADKAVSHLANNEGES